MSLTPQEYLKYARTDAPKEMLADVKKFTAMSPAEQNEFLYFFMMDVVNRVKFYHEQVRKSGN